MSTVPIVYFNGEYVEKSAVRISPDDRGFLFADGVYEVVRSYAGRLFRLDAHLGRLADGLAALRMSGVDLTTLRAVFPKVIEANRLGREGATVYLQITRGAAPRGHAFPDPSPPPTVYAEARPFVARADPEAGVAVITVPDVRWARCDIKSVALLPNVLANQRAREAGAVEAVFVRDGVVLEGTASSLFAVFDGEVRTVPKTNYILPGVTRQVVLDLCAAHSIAARQAPIQFDELAGAEEIFLAGTTVEVMPVVTVDGRAVGDGRPGPVTRCLRDLFRNETGADS